jgi:DNA-nicking Smr family endonuclease
VEGEGKGRKDGGGSVKESVKTWLLIHFKIISFLSNTENRLLINVANLGLLGPK